jgi:D-aspartate ligase
MKRVGIFDADSPGALAFVRSLGRRGVPLRVYSHRRWPVSRSSRYCAEFARCPDIEDADRFVPWLERELLGGRIDLVAPTSDLIAFYAAELGESLPAHGAVLDCLFKDRFDAACARLGFRTPRAAYPASLEEARELAPQLRYPALLKPKSHVGVGLFERGEVVRNVDEMRRRYRSYELPARYARYPELALPMIQEYVPAALENLYSVSGLLGANGEVVAASASCKAGQWPPILGVGIEFHAVPDADLIARGIALARGVLGAGLFEVEFIRDRQDGELMAIDLNPRAHGFISFDIARGHDLPLLWYRVASGELVEPCAPACCDLVWLHRIPWQVRRWVRRGRGLPIPPAPADPVDIVNDVRDLLPSALFTAVMLRHPGGLIRPFWKEEVAPPDAWGAGLAT